jgi:NOL1/NOP2/fmu family ribosome biogenesis protein
MKGKNLVPAHGLAMHPQITFNVPDFPLDAASALSYLRKSDIYLDNNYTGWATVSYNGLRLGWIKKIPQRINNYYPMGYRLRK